MLKIFKKIAFNKQLHNLSIYGFGQLFNLVTPLLVAPFIVDICGEENFGKTAVGMAISFFLIVFIDYGSDIVGVREIAVNRNDKVEIEKIFISTYIIKFLTLCAVLTIAALCISIFPYFKEEKALFFLGLTVLVGQFLNPTWFLQGMENVKLITFLNIISKSIYLLGVFFTIKLKSDYIYVNFWWGIGMITANFLTLFIIVFVYKFTWIKFTRKDIFSHMRKDFSMFSSQIFLSIQLYSPVVLISMLGNNLFAGQYRIIDQIIVVFKTYIFLFFNFVFPKVCYLLEHNKPKGYKNWIIYNGFNFILIAIMMFIIHTYSYDVVSYFNPTNRYVLSNLLQVAIYIPMLLAISIPLKQLILGFNLKKYYIYVTYFVVTITVILIIILLRTHQVYGVFYSLIISEVITIIFYLYALKKEISKHKNDKIPFPENTF